MLDKNIRQLLDPYLLKIARWLLQVSLDLKKNQLPNFNADSITALGIIFCFIAVFAIINGNFYFAIIFIILNRLCDGLDGFFANDYLKLLSSNTKKTVHKAIGGFIDIVADFIFYATIPVGFALYNPDANAVATSILLASFLGTGISFLAASIVNSQLPNKIAIKQKNHKSFFYAWGLMEGTETIAFFIVMCVLPNFYATIAYCFAALCALTTFIRIYGLLKIKNIC